MADWADLKAIAIYKAANTHGVPLDIRISEIAAALRNARLEALEEAARECDRISKDVFTFLSKENSEWMRATALDCAAGIRARKDN